MADNENDPYRAPLPPEQPPLAPYQATQPKTSTANTAVIAILAVMAVFVAAAAVAAILYFTGVIGGGDDEAAPAPATSSAVASPSPAAPSTTVYGDDRDLDRQWDACAAGDMLACDDLWLAAPLESDYEEFGATCGNTQEPSAGMCDLLYGSGEGFGDGLTPDPADTAEGWDYGSNAELDGLWDACEAGDMVACDDLYMESPLFSPYEEYASTCGGRVESDRVNWCTDIVDDGVLGV